MPKVLGHEGALYAGEIEGVPALVLAGRVHLYEGHAPAEVAHAIDQVADAGCELVVLTNAAGAINTALKVGEIALIRDPQPHRLEPARRRARIFSTLPSLYDKDMRELARSVSPGLCEGVYAGVLGPVYETPAEVLMLSTLGADLVGMSTVHEAIAARARGMRVLAMSVVTNAAAGITGVTLDHEEVRDAGLAAAERVEGLLRGVLARL